MDCPKNIEMHIDTDAIKHNLEYLAKKSKTEIMAVLKSNAYGHGLGMAKIVRDLGVKHIGVAKLSEAIELREVGDKGRILFWLYDITCPEFKKGLSMNLDIGLFDETHIPILSKMSSIKQKVTLYIDTGFNRAGIPYEKAFDACIALSKCKNLEFTGLMSHMISGGTKNNTVNTQLKKFRDLIDKLAQINIKPLTHMANTEGCLNYDVSDFTLSRCGSGLYGITKSKINKLRLTTSLTTHIIQIKTLEKGDSVGYNSKFISPKEMNISILPIGYADILIDNSSHNYVYINNTKRKVLGNVGMDQMVVEGNVEDRVNDVAYIFDTRHTIYDIAKKAGKTPIEYLSQL